jgi:surfeit locus 1 family protein
VSAAPERSRPRIPVLSTIIVLLAVAAMVALGLWQLDRRGEKEALLARYSANLNLPPRPLVALFPVEDGDLFRRTSASCLSVVGWDSKAGRDAQGRSGWRHVASCRTGAEGPGFAADMGVSQSADAPRWTGGEVRGRLVWASDGGTLIGRLFGRTPPQLAMIVAADPAPGLSPSAQPDPAGVPNNHLAYAVQWFLFAGVALTIYAVALWRRSVAPGERQS